MSVSNKKAAFEARRQFEAGSINQDLLIELYRNYTDVGDTARFVSKAKDIFPDGNCGLASLYLQKRLGGEVTQGKYGEYDHTFLVADKTVIDITADQFGGPKVYVGPLQPPWSLIKNVCNTR
ncbi:hypothetical protein KGM48_01830 [Patescibacteria group bacterium]|nr:hypothetical protein [Patescibacteria group bacterium]